MLARAIGYLELGRLQARTVLAFRADYLIGLLGLLLRVVWTAVYAHRDSVGGIGLGTTIAYATLASVQSWLLNPWEFSLIPQSVVVGLVTFWTLETVGMFIIYRMVQQFLSGTLVPL